MYKKARRIYSDKRRGACLRVAFIFKKVRRDKELYKLWYYYFPYLTNRINVFLFDFIIRSKYFSVSDWLK